MIVNKFFKVYINLLDQKEPKLNLQNTEVTSFKNDNKTDKEVSSRIIIKPSARELDLHKNFLKSSLQKNYYN